jgi:hypothetical protein
VKVCERIFDLFMTPISPGDVRQSLFYFRIDSTPDDACGQTSDDRIRWNIFRNDGPGTNVAEFSDFGIVDVYQLSGVRIVMKSRMGSIN